MTTYNQSTHAFNTARDEELATREALAKALAHRLNLLHFTFKRLNQRISVESTSVTIDEFKLTVGPEGWRFSIVDGCTLVNANELTAQLRDVYGSVFVALIKAAESTLLPTIESQTKELNEQRDQSMNELASLA